MKRIAAFFAFIMMTLSALCFSVSAAEDVADKKAEDSAAPMGEAIFTPENAPLIVGIAVGVFVVLAIVFLIVSHTTSRKKYMAKRAKKKEEAKMRALIEAKLAGKDIDGDESAQDSYAYDPYGYYYGYGAPQHWNHPTYKTIENSAVQVPARDVKAVPEIKEEAAKKVKAVAMVQPVVVKDLVTVPRDCPKCKTLKLEDTKKDNGTVKKIAATVALTAIGCHLLGKLKK